MIHTRDPEDTLGTTQKQSQQLQYSYDVEMSKIDPRIIQNVIVGGMGGSALAALMLDIWPSLDKPFEIVKNYDLPAYADEKTLFIASSYSGNTEETLSALSQAEASKCQIIVIASGGKLAEIARSKNYPLFQIPSGFQPRMAVLYNFSALVQISDHISSNKYISELHSSAEWLGEQTSSLLPDVPTTENQAKQIALELVGSSVVIYSGPTLWPVAYKWKININENAKSIAWTNTIPEFNHNEFLGWTSHPVDKPYKVIDLRSSFDNERVQKRFEITERLLSGKRPVAHQIDAKGDTALKQILWTIQLGDFVSLYLALLNGLNPAPVDLIEKFKQLMNE